MTTTPYYLPTVNATVGPSEFERGEAHGRLCARVDELERRVAELTGREEQTRTYAEVALDVAQDAHAEATESGEDADTAEVAAVVAAEVAAEAEQTAEEAEEVAEEAVEDADTAEGDDVIEVEPEPEHHAEEHHDDAPPARHRARGVYGRRR